MIIQDGRKQLEQAYGKGCMFKKAKVEEQIYALRSKKIIKSYKTFLKETKYKSGDCGEAVPATEALDP